MRYMEKIQLAAFMRGLAQAIHSGSKTSGHRYLFPETFDSKAEPYANGNHMQRGRLYQSRTNCKEWQPDTLLQRNGNKTRSYTCSLGSLETIYFVINKPTTA